MKQGQRAIVVITEGAPWELLQRWCTQGRLPAFQRLFSSGSGGRLLSGPIPYEVPGLTSAFTGRLPGEHGWFSYWAAQNPAYLPRVLQPSDLRHPYIWQRPECQSLRFAIVNLFGTHPPGQINGWVISYPTEQTVRACFPKTLLWELSQQGIHYAHDVSIWYSGQSRHEFVSRACLADEQRLAAARSLWRQEPDVLIVNLTSIDRVCHFYWQELEPGSPFKEEETAIFRAFSTCDRALGELLSLVDERTSLIAFSEIGFGPLRAYCAVNRVLAKAGALTWETEDKQAAWSRTVAFEAVQGTHGVNINMTGRQNEGIVALADYERARGEVMAALAEAINPHTGLKLFRRVLPREEVYSGEAVEAAPDILLEPLDERYLPLGDNFWASHVNRTLQSGWHRRESYFAAVGPVFGAGVKVDNVSPVDVTPSLYHALGRMPAADFSGRVVS